jgi:hypothetical protein
LSISANIFKFSDGATLVYDADKYTILDANESLGFQAYLLSRKNSSEVATIKIDYVPKDQIATICNDSNKTKCSKTSLDNGVYKTTSFSISPYLLNEKIYTVHSLYFETKNEKNLKPILNEFENIKWRSIK